MTIALDGPVPDFTAATTGGEFTLSAVRGKLVVLYFYPKDHTSGCTTEGRDFAALHPKFVRAGAVVLGVSRDSLRSHASFREKLGLPFELISDPEEKLCTLFDVIRQKTMYGRPARGIERSSFLIDRDGRLRRVWRGVKVPGHAEAVLAAVMDV